MTMTTDAPEPDAAPADEEEAGTSTSWVHRIGLDRFSGLYLLGIFFIFFGLTESNFLIWNGSIEFVLTEKVIVVMLALAFLVPLTTGTFDLSIGATMALVKRQRTYFRRDPRIAWVPWQDEDVLAGRGG